MKKLTIICCLLGLFGALSTDATAGRKRTSAASAREHLDRGLAHFRAERYRLAIREFRTGYRLDPDPTFLFALAQAQRLRGDCASAETYYRRFLATGPAPRQAEAARAARKQCQRARAAARPTPRPRVASTRATSRPALAMRTSEEQPAGEARWYDDPLTGALLGAGVITTVLGAATYATSSDAADAARAAEDDGEADHQVGRALHNRTVGVLALAAGGALIGTAIYRYVHADDEGDDTRLTIGAESGGASVGLSGTF